MCDTVTVIQSVVLGFMLHIANKRRHFWAEKRACTPSAGEGEKCYQA